MTTLGKILVFFNLVISVLVGGLVVVVFTARTNYAAAVDKLNQYRAADQAAAQAKIGEIAAQKADYDKIVAEKDAALNKLAADLKTQLKVNEGYKEGVNKDIVDRNAAAALKGQMQALALQHQKDVEQMTERLEKANAKITDMVKEVNKLTSETLLAQISEKTALDNLGRLEKQYQEQAKVLARMQAGPATPSAGGLTAKNPPPEKIDGQVTSTSGELLKLSVGSDSNLKVGQTLELFRLGQRPQYLGTVRITSIEAKAAVAKPIDRLIGAPQVGDNVSSRIGS